jgi:hypothetical protein
MVRECFLMQCASDPAGVLRGACQAYISQDQSETMAVHIAVPFDQRGHCASLLRLDINAENSSRRNCRAAEHNILLRNPVQYDSPPRMPSQCPSTALYFSSRLFDENQQGEMR